METGSSTRASDDDRRQVVRALEHHTAAGRLRLEEFDQRVSAALAAVTLADLAALTSDLPEAPPRAAPRPDPHADARSLMIALALAVLTLVLLGAILAIAR